MRQLLREISFYLFQAKDKFLPVTSEKHKKAGGFLFLTL